MILNVVNMIKYNTFLIGEIFFAHVENQSCEKYEIYSLN